MFRAHRNAQNEPKPSPRPSPARQLPLPSKRNPPTRAKPRQATSPLKTRKTNPNSSWLLGYMATWRLLPRQTPPKRTKPRHHAPACPELVEAAPNKPTAPQKPTPRHTAPQLRAPAQNEPTAALPTQDSALRTQDFVTPRRRKTNPPHPHLPHHAQPTASPPQGSGLIATLL
jgi:hypothetical protein